MNRVSPGFLFLFLILNVGSSNAQTNRYIVFFKDKIGTPYSLAAPELFLSEKALARRTKQNILPVDADLPVNPNYINDVSGTGAKILFATKWMNGVLVEATASQFNDIENLNSVDKVEFIAKEKTGYSGGRTRSQNKFELIESSQATMTQNSILAIDEMHSDGVTGAGITIAVLDTGFPGVLTNPSFTHIISSNRILDSYNFGTVSSNAFVGHPHGAQVFSVMAASTTLFEGGAYDANFLLYATEFIETEYRIEEYNWLCAAERADSAGADIITTSLGYTDFDDPSMDYSYPDLDGKTAVITRAANMAVERGIVVITSAGNYGNKLWKYISPPADGNNVLAVGSVDSNLSHSDFSSYGPPSDDDERFKPDVMALGGPGATLLPDGSLKYETGTSISCPQIASLAAGVMQNWPELTTQQVIQLIRDSGSRSFKPDNTYGYGIPSYRGIKSILEPTMNVEVYPNPVENILKVKLPILIADGSASKLQVYSMLGQLLLEVNHELTWYLNPFELDLSSFDPGQYVVRVQNKEANKSFRIIKR